MKYLIIILLLISYPSFAKKPKKQTQGFATVIDGDTIEIRGKRFRLFGIDAFESNQKCLDASQRKYLCGNKSANFLDTLLINKTVTCIHKGKSWNRVVAICSVGNNDLAQSMVRSGWALAWRKYSRRYLKDMDHAKQNKLGAWSGSFTKPWLFRKS